MVRRDGALAEDLATAVVFGEDAGDKIITGLAVHPWIIGKEKRLFFVLFFERLGFTEQFGVIEPQSFFVGLDKPKLTGIIYCVGKKCFGWVVCFFQEADGRFQVGWHSNQFSEFNFLGINIAFF